MDLAAFISASLALWRVQGTVEPRSDTIIVRTGDTEIVIERVIQPPFRWMVAHGGRKRPCTSILGVLSTLRTALDVDRGAPLRVTPAPAP